VYRTDTTGFYLLTGDVVLDPDSYHLIGGELLVSQNQNTQSNGNLASLPIATNNDLGGVIIRDGLTITPDGFLSISYDPNSIGITNNKLYAKVTGSVPYATYVIHGSVQVDQNRGIKISDGVIGLSIDNNTIKLSSTDGDSVLYTDASSLVLPKASTTVLGSIKIGDGLSANPINGVTSVVKASETQLGGIKVGVGLSANPNDGQLNVTTLGTSLSSNGYQKFPGGLIMQWGVLSAVALNETYYKVTLPIRFPNAIWNVQATLRYDTAFSGSVNSVVKGLSTTQFYVAGDHSIDPPTTGDIMWQAIGY